MKWRVRVVHSKSNPAWNVVGEIAGGRYNRVPYVPNTGSEIIDTREKASALDIAEFIVRCVNNREDIDAFLASRNRAVSP